MKNTGANPLVTSANSEPSDTLNAFATNTSTQEETFDVTMFSDPVQVSDCDTSSCESGNVGSLTAAVSSSPILDGHDSDLSSVEDEELKEFLQDAFSEFPIDAFDLLTYPTII